MQVIAVGINIMQLSEEERKSRTHRDEIEQPGLEWVEATWAYSGEQ